jgi:glutamate dehydrogenase
MKPMQNDESTPRDADNMQADHVKTIVKALASHSLPGDLDNFGKEARATAAAFVGGALARRQPEEASMAVDTHVDSAGQRQMRLAVVNANMPFLVDSVAAVIAAKGLVIDRLLHPLVSVVRDDDGNLISVDKAGSPIGNSESIIYIETERAEARTRAEIQTELAANLIDVRNAVSDWPKLVEAMRADATAMSDTEDTDLLTWFASDHFTLLSVRARTRDQVV